MTGQLNPFRLRAPSVSVSASDLMKGQAQLGSHLKGGITGLSQFGQQQNTNELNDLIARGELEGMSTDEAQRTIAELGLTGGVTKDMGNFMEQGHQGRQQEDRQRQATDVASTLFSRQEDTAKQKAQTAKDLVDYKIANPTAKSLINTGAGIYDPNEKKWIAGPDGTTKQPFKPTGQIGSAFKNATKNGKKAIELGASMDPNFNVRPVKIGKDKSGNDKFSKTNFEYLYNGNVYANPETLLADIEKSQEQQGKQPTVIGGPDARPVNPSQVNAEDIGPKDTRGLQGMLDRTGEGIASLFRAKDPVQEMRDARALKAKELLYGGKDEASNTSVNQLFTGDNTTAGKVPYTVTGKKDFIEQTTPVAESVARKIGPNIKPEWLVNMWRHETDNGRSKITQNTFNLGNIKSKAGQGYDAGKVWEQTKEGKDIKQQSSFRKYDNFKQAGEDFAKFLSTPRYKKVRQAKTKKEFYTELQKAGYATDTEYANKLMKF